MTLKLLMAVLISMLIPAISFSQQNTEPDRIPAGCDGKVFITTEKKPSLKVTMDAYQDSLMSYFSSKKVTIPNSAFPCRFILTSNSKILDLHVGVSHTPYAEILTNAILKFEHLLVPAVQNSYLVCSYITFLCVFENGNINVVILQKF